MVSLSLLRQLLDELEVFDDRADGVAYTLAEFSNHLQEKVRQDEQVSDVRFGKLDQESQALAFELENNIARLLTYLARYAKFYTKKALKSSRLQTGEEFSYLALLLTCESMTKTELIQKNLHEKGTGIEIIRRLIALKLIVQEPDAGDRRSKRLSITADGRNELYGVFQNMGYTTKLLMGDLSKQEKKTLQALLLKLEHFHHRLYEEKAVSVIDDVKSLVQRRQNNE